MNDITALKKVLMGEERLIRLKPEGKAVFIGDTHGDFDATEAVFREYFKPGHTLVFLGDYVDRGPDSKTNIEFLLEKKLQAPEQVFLLAGNHEGHCLVPFSPADFWESLAPHEYKSFSDLLQFLPFAAITDNGIFAAHGAPPDVKAAEEINMIQLCDEHWHQLTWGDFTEKQESIPNTLTGRPTFGKDYFNRVMKQIGENVLIRSHQPRIKPVIFDNRCLTLMTSYAYTFSRLIAIADMEKPHINSIDDLEIREI
jgi:predicted MPP superfamily phosphohydrolase